MVKWHGDMFMWNTIKEVAPHLTEEEQEQVYTQLEDKTWRIDDIERLSKELGKQSAVLDAIDNEQYDFRVSRYYNHEESQYGHIIETSLVTGIEDAKRQIKRYQYGAARQNVITASFHGSGELEGFIGEVSFYAYEKIKDLSIDDFWIYPDPNYRGDKDLKFSGTVDDYKYKLEMQRLLDTIERGQSKILRNKRSNELFKELSNSLPNKRLVIIEQEELLSSNMYGEAVAMVGPFNNENGTFIEHLQAAYRMQPDVIIIRELNSNKDLIDYADFLAKTRPKISFAISTTDLSPSNMVKEIREIAQQGSKCMQKAQKKKDLEEEL